MVLRMLGRLPSEDGGVPCCRSTGRSSRKEKSPTLPTAASKEKSGLASSLQPSTQPEDAVADEEDEPCCSSRASSTCPARLPGTCEQLSRPQQTLANSVLLRSFEERASSSPWPHQRTAAPIPISADSAMTTGLTM